MTAEAATPPAPPGTKARARRAAKRLLMAGSAATARAMALTPRGPRFHGAFVTRAAALASLPAGRRAGYDDEDVAQVSFEQMCERVAWDYPLVFWLDRLLQGAGTVVDAGGHLGTKYIAFSGILDLTGVDWVVYDLPGIVAAARKRQAAGQVPPGISFVSSLANLPETDLLLGSGLLQYLDIPFADLVGALGAPPRHILLNKVALRDGPAVFTIERIGRGRVPYQIRSRADFDAEIAALGYRVADSWNIPSLGHVIPTHPRLGISESRGFLLERRSSP